MEFWKHKAGIFLLILSIILLIAAIWYFMFYVPESPAERGGILVEHVTEMEMIKQI